MWYAIRDWVLEHGYRWFVRPWYFRQDAEDVHDSMVKTGQMLGRSPFWRSVIRFWFYYEHPMLRTTLAGIDLKNPIGLAAGFDKEGKLTSILSEVGFGFQAVGSVTGTMTPGNPKPRMWRLPKSKSIAVHLGLNSSGSAVVADRLHAVQRPLPISLSIAKANIAQTDAIEAGIGDFLLAAKNLRGLATQWEINISCPNTSGGEPFSDPDTLGRLLTRLMPEIKGQPVYIKLPVDLDRGQLDRIIEASQRHGVTGFICTNLLKNRQSKDILDAHVPPQGGLSGKVLERGSNEVLAYLYKRTHGDMPLIGVGGVCTAEDAYRKIRLGASAIQLITGMIYEGPSVISEIQRGLVRLLQRDGFSNISAAVGADVT